MILKTSERKYLMKPQTNGKEIWGRGLALPLEFVHFKPTIIIIANKNCQTNSSNLSRWTDFGCRCWFYVGNISNIGFLTLLRTVKFYLKTSTGSWNLWSAEVEFLINNLLSLFPVNLNKYEPLDCHGWSLDLVGYIQSISLVKLLSNLVNLFRL